MNPLFEKYKTSFEKLQTASLGDVGTWHRFFTHPDYESDCANLPLAMNYHDYDFLAGLSAEDKDRLILEYAVRTWHIFADFAFKHHNVGYVCQIVVYDETEECPELRLFPKLAFMRVPKILSEFVRPISQPFGFKLISILSVIKSDSPPIVREGPVLQDVGPVFYIDFERRRGELRKTIVDE
jgi:hypothetical protein